MQIEGQIKMIEEERQITSTFKNRKFVITTDSQYPQHIQLELKQDKCDLVNSYRKGDSVIAHVNILGREWVNPQGETQYFNSIECWKIEKVNV